MIKDYFALIDQAYARGDADVERILVCKNFASYMANGGVKSEVYAPLCEDALSAGAKRLYVPTLDLADKEIDRLIDYTLSGEVTLCVTCAQTLTDVGIIDARFSRSPVMLLHEFGLLERSSIISGVYLDKDDLSLMAQENVPLVVLPSADAGHGYGVAPVCAALEKGVTLKIGTGDGAYNKTRNLRYECDVLGLLVSAQMNRRDAVAMSELEKMVER